MFLVGVIINQGPRQFCTFKVTPQTRPNCVSRELNGNRTNMDQRFFAKTPYQIPFYNYGTGFGCLQRAVADTKQILPSQSDRSAFTIDSILAHNCSRDTDPSESTSRMAITNAERYFPGRADQLRFHPYFNLPQTTLGQTNTFVKASTKNGKSEERYFQ